MRRREPKNLTVDRVPFVLCMVGFLGGLWGGEGRGGGRRKEFFKRFRGFKRRWLRLVLEGLRLDGEYWF